MVAHTWAHQLQSEASNSGRTFYFEGDTIYSYGKHFAIARMAKNERGEEAVLFTLCSYSNTTRKHIAIVRNAVSNQNIIYVNDPSASVGINLLAFESLIKNALKGLNTARKKEKYINPAKQLLEQARIYCEFMGGDVPKSLVDLVVSAENGEYAKYLQIEAERIAKEEAERELLRNARFALALSKWRKGGKQSLSERREEIDYLRIQRASKRIETSQGVLIPVEIGKRAYVWILAKMKSGGCNGECKYKILDFEVSEVNEVSVKIGCHTILHTEIDRIAKKLNWK